MATRWLIVDDHSMFLRTARRVLGNEGVDVVGVASTIGEAVARCRELHPDGVLVDIVLGAESGFDLARTLAASVDPPPTVVLMSTHAEEDFASLIAESPAIGFLAKSELSARAIADLVRRHEDEQRATPS